MKYDNPHIPEGINAHTRHPLKEFAVLSVQGSVLLLVLVVLAVVLGSVLGRHLPFSWERSLAERVLDLPADDARVEQRLQDLADRLAAEMDLPPEMTITVHYIDEPVINAAATIGGHVLVYRGLLSRLPHENALAMLLGHEIAHVKNRDVAANVGSGALLTLVGAAVTGRSSGLVDGIANGTSLLVLLQFGRDAERAADEDGLTAVAALYGHIGGADDLYRVLSGEGVDLGISVPEILQSHPLTEDRRSAIAALAESRGWARKGRITPLPEALEVPRPEATPASD